MSFLHSEAAIRPCASSSIEKKRDLNRWRILCTRSEQLQTQEMNMRVLTIAVVAVGLSVGGCTRADTAAAPRDQNAAAAKSLVPTGATGAADAVRPTNEPVRALAEK